MTVTEPTDAELLAVDGEATEALDDPVLGVKLTRQPRKKMDVDVDKIVGGPVKAPPTAPFFVPSDESFGQDEYESSAALEQLREYLVDEHETLKHLKGHTSRIDVVWKRKAVQSKTHVKRGQCQKLTGVTVWYGGFDFLIWLAADECRGWSRRQVEQLLYHELCHVGRDSSGKSWLIDHDVQAFTSEVAYYGLRPEWESFGKAVQLSLDA